MYAQHSSLNDDWQTPPHIISLVHQVLGQIDIDPASSINANKVVKAKRIITQEEDALSLDYWIDQPSVMYLNPPGKKRGNKSLVGLFWKKLMEHWELGLVEHAIFMGFSLEHLAVLQGYHAYSLCDFHCFIPRKRIAFVDPLDQSNRKRPSHSNVITYIPGLTNKTSLFKKVFSQMEGKFMHGA